MGEIVGIVGVVVVLVVSAAIAIFWIIRSSHNTGLVVLHNSGIMVSDGHYKDFSPGGWPDLPNYNDVDRLAIDLDTFLRKRICSSTRHDAPFDGVTLVWVPGYRLKGGVRDDVDGVGCYFEDKPGSGVWLAGSCGEDGFIRVAWGLGSELYKSALAHELTHWWLLDRDLPWTHDHYIDVWKSIDSGAWRSMI